LTPEFANRVTHVGVVSANGLHDHAQPRIVNSRACQAQGRRRSTGGLGASIGPQLSGTRDAESAAHGAECGSLETCGSAYYNLCWERRHGRGRGGGGAMPDEDLAVDATRRAAVIDAICSKLHAYYVFPEV